jgi:mono/diheme cytochrome c family protein
MILSLTLSNCKKDDSSDEPQDPWVAAYNNSVISTGGIMYDKFWSTESGFDQNNEYLATLNASSNFFRCKQCHGWDGFGSNGAYISRAPKTTRPNVSSLNLYQFAKTKTPLELFQGMTATTNRRDISYDLSTYDPDANNTEGDKMPNLNQILTDAQIWDMVKFMKEGMFDVTALYDATYEGSYPTGSMTITNVGRDGNAVNGNTFYTANCTVCHGADGTNLDLEGKTMGKFVRTKANEVQHKVKYGQLGSSMVGKFDITLGEMKDLYKACADTTTFPD